MNPGSYTDKCAHCNDTGIEPGTIVVSPGEGFGFNSLDPDPLNRGSYVPCKVCGGIKLLSAKETDGRT